MEFRLRHLQGSQRAQRVLDAVAGMSGWSRRRENDRELGVAFAEYHHTLIAGIAEISLEDDLIRVHDVWVAIDPGVAVQPDNIRAQVMGAVVYGLGNALTERITFRNGRVQQANFNDYPVPTMADSAAGSILEILPGGDEPSAVGQTGAVLVAPAIANAFERLTGKRLAPHAVYPGTRQSSPKHLTWPSGSQTGCSLRHSGPFVIPAQAGIQ